MTSNEALAWFPTLMYHRVVTESPQADPFGLCVTTDQLRVQLDYLKQRGYRSMHPLEGIRRGRGRLAERSIAITFDDGYMDFFTNALPLLAEYGFSATVFLVSDFIGGWNEWDRGSAPTARLMGLKEIREALASGISFGSHSRSHPRLAEIPIRRAEAEILESKAALEQKLGTPVPLFAYPHGSSNASVRRAVADAGFSAAFGIEKSRHERFHVSRIDAARSRGTRLDWWYRVTGRRYRWRARLGRMNVFP